VYEIKSGSTSPYQLGSNTIYRENTEWTPMTNISGADFDYTINPFSGLKSAYFPGFTNGQYFKFTDGVLHDLDNYSYVKFYIRLGASFSGKYISVKFNESGTKRTNYLAISNGSYGFNANLLNTWQLVAIPMNEFIYDDVNFNELYFVTSGSGSAFQIDNVQLQSGGITISSGVTSFNGMTGNVIGAFSDSAKINSDTSLYEFYNKYTGVRVFTLPTLMVNLTPRDTCIVIDSIGPRQYTIGLNPYCVGSGSGPTDTSLIREIVSDSIAGKLNISDTAALVANYADKINDHSDTLAAHNIRIGANTSAIATKQAALSGTGIVKSTAGTISYLTDPLPVLNGGTGTGTPGLVAGTNITSITGTWPNQTINAASGGASGLDAAMAIDSNTTHQLISTQKILSRDSSISNVNYSNSVNIGDSITAQTDSVFYYGTSIEVGTGATSAPFKYTTLLSASNKLSTFESNNGISSTRMVKLTNGDNSFIDRLSSIPSYRSTMRYFIIGTYAVNDCNLTSGIGIYITSLSNAIDTLLLNRNYPAKKIVVLTPSVSWSTVAGKNYDSMKLYSDATIAVAKSKGVILIDVFKYMMNSGGRSLISSDSIHPNNAGHLAIADAINMALGSAKINGSLIVKRSATIYNKLGVGTTEYADGDGSITGNFKAQQGTNFITFNGSTANSIFQVSTNTTGNYLRLLSQGASGQFIGSVGANSLAIQSNSATRYLLSSSGAHTVTAVGWTLTNTGTTTGTLTGALTYTSSASAGTQYNFFGNSTSTLLRFNVGNNSTNEMLTLSQSGSAKDVTASAQGDMVIRAYSVGADKKLFFATGSTAVQNMTLFPTKEVNIGSNLTVVPSSILDVNSTTQGSRPFPSMTTTQRTAIPSPAEGLSVYDLTLHKLYVFDGTTWQAAW